MRRKQCWEDCSWERNGGSTVESFVAESGIVSLLRFAARMGGAARRGRVMSGQCYLEKSTSGV